MYATLLHYIEDYSGAVLSATDAAWIRAAFQPRKLRKRQYLLKEGDVSRQCSFITKGALRQYGIDEKGNEKIVQFYIEQHWAADRESLLAGAPSVYTIEAWEDSELLSIAPKELYALAEKVPAVARMLRVMDDRHAVALHRRLNSMICNTAEARYLEFAKNFPHFVQRFPQHHIASYLGVTKETLSRVKRQAMQPKAGRCWPAS